MEMRKLCGDSSELRDFNYTYVKEKELIPPSEEEENKYLEQDTLEFEQR